MKSPPPHPGQPLQLLSVVDDGSTDSTWAVLDGLRKRIAGCRPVQNTEQHGFGRLNEGWDAVFGSRFVRGGGMIDYPRVIDGCRPIVSPHLIRPWNCRSKPSSADTPGRSSPGAIAARGNRS